MPLGEHDAKGAPPVAVINETMVRLYFKDEDPIGKRILVQEIVPGKTQLGPEIPWEVVGVVADEKVNNVDKGRQSRECMCPTSRARCTSRHWWYARRWTRRGCSRRSAAVHQINKDQTFTDMKTLDQIKAESMATNRLQSMLLTVFAGIAVLLAAIGIYGVISYSVEQRTHEIGIRAALGASKGDLLRLILRSGMLMAAIGLVLGLAGAFGLTRLLANLLFGVGARDPVTIGAVGVILGAVALLACYIPARRATRVDPMIALRYE